MINLFHGDCFDILPNLIEKNIKVDLVLIDPPYNQTSQKWDIELDLKKMWELIEQIKKDKNTPTIIFGAEPFSSYLRLSNISQYKYDLYWVKNKKTNFLNAKRQPLRNMETISVFYEKQCLYKPIITKGHERKIVKNRKAKSNVYNKEKGYRNYNSTERYPTNTLYFNVVNQNEKMHPNEKPIKLLEHLIETYTNKGDLIIDFFMGSGSTKKACCNKNRNFIGIEKDLNYYNIAKGRIL